MTIKHEKDNHDTEDKKESENKIPDHGEGLMNVNQKSLPMFCKRKYVIIDVGGERFQADRNTFLTFPNTTTHQEGSHARSAQEGVAKG